MTKPRHLKAYLESGECKANKIIFADAYDVLFADSPEAIAEEAEDTWVSGCEENCFPEAGMACDFPQTESRFKYLNSGFIVSTPDQMLAVLESMNLHQIPGDHRLPNGQWSNPNDQYFFQLEFCKQPIPMRLDYQANIVLNLCNIVEGELDFSGDKIKCNVTGSFPKAMHFNGGAKTGPFPERVLRHLKLR